MIPNQSVNPRWRTNSAGRNRTLLGVGVVGSLIAAICCFTPLLVIALGAVGLSAWLAWMDYVLLPALVLFVGITLYALARRKKVSAAECRHTEEVSGGSAARTRNHIK